MKPYVVFMCTKCRGFTNAPAGQKRRRCSYCGSIIDIAKTNLALFDTPEQAAAAVKEFNASKGESEFKEAVERSRERVKSLLPPKYIKAADIIDDNGEPISQGKRRILMKVLEEEAKKKPCSLDKLEEICNAKGLPWGWVEKQIEGLANNGALIFPRPWIVQLVMSDERETAAVSPTKDVANEIITLLRKRGSRMRVDEIIQYFASRGIGENAVETSLERLMRSGDVFQPAPGIVSIV